MLVNNSIAQQLIRNQSFEDVNPPNNWDIKRYFEKLDVWDQDANIFTCTGLFGDNEGYLHSPDWFHTIKRPINEGFLVGGVLQYSLLLPYEGDAFIGMGNCELIQQRFSFQNRPLEKGKYILKFQIRIANYTNLGLDWSNTDYGILDVYLSNKKIKYKQDKCNWCEDCECSDFNKYCWKQYRVNQEIITVSQIPLSPSLYPPGEWHEVSVVLDVPDNKYDYIALELQRPFEEYCGAYIFLDDISLTEGCINGCSSTAGGYNVWTSGGHTRTQPFSVFGLDNISHIDLEIRSGGGQELFRKISINNPPSIIAWNGKDDNYQELSAAWYGYRINVTNDCGIKEYTGIFEKKNSSLTVENYRFYNYNSVSKPPLADCCEENIILQYQNLIQDITIGLPGTPPPLLYKAGQTIIAGPQVVVPSNNIVLFEAGNTIDLLPGFEVENGAEFEANIEPCNPAKLDVDFEAKAIDIESETEEKENNASMEVFPNPFKNEIEIRFFVEQAGYVKIYISDLYGRLLSEIYNSEVLEGENSAFFNTSGISPGLYFCVMETKNNRYVQKIIKQ